MIRKILLISTLGLMPFIHSYTTSKVCPPGYISEFPQTQNGIPALIPMPQKVKILNSSLAIPKNFTISLPNAVDNNELGIDYLRSELKKRFPDISLNMSNAPNAFCNLIITDVTKIKSSQGYLMEISNNGIKISSQSNAGLFYGVMTLCNILRNSPDRQLPCCQITDYPDLELRGCFFNLRSLQSSQVADFNRLVRGLAAMKINWLVLEFAENLPIPNSPFIKRTSTLSKKDLQDIAENCRNCHIEITPQVQALTHCQWLASAGNYSDMVEGDLKTISKGWNATACPQNERAYKLTLLAIKYATRYFNSRYVHLCLDELQLGNGGAGGGAKRCPKCESKDFYTLIEKYILRLQKDIFAMNVTPMIWFDSLYRPEHRYYNFFPHGNDPKLYRILDKLDKRVFLNYWNYSPVANRPIAEYYSKLGMAFSGASYCRHPANAEQMPRLMKLVGADAVYLTYWSHLNHKYQLFDLRKASNYAIASTGISALNCWNTNVPTITALNFDPCFETVKVLDAKKYPRRFPGDCTKQVNIDSLFNRKLGNTPDYPEWSKSEVAKIKIKLSAAPEKFAFRTDNAGNYYGVELGTKQKVTIPINEKFHDLNLLMTTSRANYEMYAPKEGNEYNIGSSFVGIIKFIYADGKSKSMPWIEKIDLVNWNSRCSAVRSRFVWRALDKRGALCNLTSFDCNNPRPAEKVSAIEIRKLGDTGIQPIIFALSLGVTPEKATRPDLTPVDVEFDKIINPEIDFRPVINFNKEKLSPAFLCYDYDTNKLKYSFTKDKNYPYNEKIMSITVPANPGKNPQRVVLDIPTSGEICKKIQSLTAYLKVEQPQYLTKASIYVAQAKKVDKSFIGCIASFNVLLAKKSKWTQNSLNIKKGLIEGDGVPEGKMRFVRISFWLDNPVPTKIFIGRIGLSGDIQPQHRELYCGTYDDVWYPEIKKEINLL